MRAAHSIMFFESPLLTVAIALGAALLGLVAGSVAYAAGWRMCHGRRALGGRSYCPECGAPLSFGETIPLLSWVMQRGVCSHCGEPISLAYPMSEMLGAGVFVSVILRHGIGLQTLEILALATVLLTIAVCSLIDYRIPNACLRVAVAIRLAYLVALIVTEQHTLDLMLSSVIGAVALGVPLMAAVWLSNAMLDRDVVGFGTVKLVALVGLYLGWQQGLICIVIAFFIGAAVWLVSPAKILPVEVEGGATEGEAPMKPSALRATQEEDISEPMRLIPFAPSIVMALWCMLLLGVAPALWNTPPF